MKKLYACILFVLLVAIAGCATPLMSAAEKGDIKEVERLLAGGADVNERETSMNSGYTALHWAAVYGHANVAALLIEKGADVNAKDYWGNGYTVLHKAATNGHANVAALLIEKGADVNAKDNWGVTPLHAAVKYSGNVNIVTLLLKKGADPTIPNDSGETPLMIAQKKGNTTIARILSNAEEEFLKDKDTAAAYASKPAVKETAIIDIHTIPDFKAVPRHNDIAVIIGIENYQSVPKSDFSKSDAGIVKDYLKALGFQERNIEFITDDRATKSAIEKTIEAWLPNRIKKDSTVFIYYSGHGAPEPSTGDAYMVPFDGDPNYLNVTGYSLKRLYDNLGKLQVAEVVVVLDACFSGAGGRSVIAKGARPLVIMADASVISSNMAVLSATQGTQISTSSPEKGHGIFTYYFLKALKDGKNTISEIYEYIKPLVEDEAKQLNVRQSPSISPDAEKLKGRFGLRK